MAAQRQRGFTLIELLVALFITAIMFAFGYRALDQAFRSRREVDEQSARLIAVQQAVRTLEQDLELLAPRPVRNLIGDGYLPAVSAAQNNTIGSLGTTLSSNSMNLPVASRPIITTGTSAGGAPLPRRRRKRSVGPILRAYSAASCSASATRSRTVH